MTTITIKDKGATIRVSDIAPYVAEATRIEDRMASFLLPVPDENISSLDPHRAELLKLDARRSELQGYFDAWAAADVLVDMKKRVAAVIAARTKS